MDPVAKFALIFQAFVLLLTASCVVAFFCRVLRSEPLAVEIDAIPERALIGRHRRGFDWTACFDGWRRLAAAGVQPWVC